MARYNTVTSTGTVSSGGAITTPNSGLLTTFTGTAPYTVTTPNPVLYTGVIQNFYNSTSGNITLTSPSGVFNGVGGSGSTSQVMPAGSTITIISDGTNYIVANFPGGPVVHTTGSFSGTLTLTAGLSANPSNANISLQPTGTGTVSISAGTTGTMDNINIGGTTRGSGAFTSLAANGQGTFSANTASTGTTSGALVVTGGVGIGGKLYIGGLANIADTTASSSTSTGSLTLGGGLGVAGAVYQGGDHVISSSTAATSSSTGALRVTGGTGIGGALYVASTTTLGNTTTISSGGLYVTGGAQFESGYNVKVRYQAGSDNYSAFLAWNGMQLGNNGANYIIGGGTTAGGDLRFYVNNTNQISGSTVSPNGTLSLTLASNGNATFAGTITENSSITLKENVNPITNALDSILQLVGVTYDRKNGTNKNEAGLIAEEVHKVLPNLVEVDKDGNPTGVMYNRLTAYLIESIKELKDEINFLKSTKQ